MEKKRESPAGLQAFLFLRFGRAFWLCKAGRTEKIFCLNLTKKQRNMLKIALNFV
jgi:hypothetical protein